MPEQARASLHTIGCRLNQSETALLAAQLQAVGYRLVPFGQPTDLLVLNTCSVTQNAEADCRYAIRRTLRESPQAFVAVTGCYAQTGPEALRRLPGVDLIVGAQYKMRLPNYLPVASDLRKHPHPQLLHTRTLDRDEFVMPLAGSYETKRANLKIQDGCNFRCSFCIIPSARGGERSRECGDVVREARELISRGHRELVLTGVNIGHYRAGGLDLVGLICRLEEIQGLQRIRISSIEPTTISDTLLSHMAHSPKLCRYLHVPLQSGDDRILAAMHRRYRVQDYRHCLELARSMMPDIGLGTDVMVGFPGEDDEQFQNTHRLLCELPLGYFHVFSFSSRPGTSASRMAGNVPAATIKKRSRLLAQLSRAKRLAHYQSQIGRTVQVLFETQNDDRSWTGLTQQFMRVGVRGNGPSTSPVQLTNTLQDVRIIGAMDGLALGEIVTLEPAQGAMHQTRPSSTLPVLSLAST